MVMPMPKDNWTANFFKAYKWVIAASLAVNFTACVLIRLLPPGGFVLSDFAMFYDVSKDGMANSFARIYDQQFWAARNTLEYRYFPSFLVMFYPLTSMPLPLSFTVFFAFNSVLSILGSSAFMEMLQERVKVSKAAGSAILFFLLVFLSADPMIFGQPSVIIFFLTIHSLRFFLKGNDAAGCFLLGVTVIIKPVMITVAVLAVLKRKERFVKRAIAVLLPLVPDVLIFLVNSGLVRGFVDLNVAPISRASYRLFSTSFMNVISIVAMRSVGPVQVASFAACVVLGILVTRKSSDVTMFAYGSFVFLVVFPDVWTSQYVFIFPFLVLFTAGSFTGAGSWRIGRCESDKRLALAAIYIVSTAAKNSFVNVITCFGLLPQDLYQVAFDDALAYPWYVLCLALNVVTCSMVLVLFTACFVAPLAVKG